MVVDHVDAIDALLTAGGFAVVADGSPAPADANALPVFHGGAPEGVPQQRYAVLWTDSGQHERTKYAGASDRIDMLVTVVSVGLTQRQALWVVDKALTALLDQTPAVAGRVCDPIEHDDTHPLHRDPTSTTAATDAVYEQVDVFKLTSYPG